MEQHSFVKEGVQKDSTLKADFALNDEARQYNRDENAQKFEDRAKHFQVIIVGAGFAGTNSAKAIWDLQKDNPHLNISLLVIDKGENILPKNSTSSNQTNRLHLGTHYFDDYPTMYSCLISSVEFLLANPKSINDGTVGDPTRSGSNYIMSNSLVELEKIVANSLRLRRDYAELLKNHDRKQNITKLLGDVSQLIKVKVLPEQFKMLQDKCKLYSQQKSKGQREDNPLEGFNVITKILNLKDYPHIKKEIECVDAQGNSSKEHIIAVVESSEPQVVIKKYIEEVNSIFTELGKSNNFDFTSNTKVTSITPRLEKTGYLISTISKDGVPHYYTADIVVNAAWSDASILTKQLGIETPETENTDIHLRQKEYKHPIPSIDQRTEPRKTNINRVKISTVVKADQPVNETFMFASGPFASSTIKNDEEAIVTYEPATNIGWYLSDRENLLDPLSPLKLLDIVKKHTNNIPTKLDSPKVTSSRCSSSFDETQSEPLSTEGSSSEENTEDHISDEELAADLRSSNDNNHEDNDTNSIDEKLLNLFFANKNLDKLFNQQYDITQSVSQKEWQNQKFSYQLLKERYYVNTLNSEKTLPSLHKIILLILSNNKLSQKNNIQNLFENAIAQNINSSLDLIFENASLENTYKNSSVSQQWNDHCEQFKKLKKSYLDAKDNPASTPIEANQLINFIRNDRSIHPSSSFKTIFQQTIKHINNETLLKSLFHNNEFDKTFVTSSIADNYMKDSEWNDLRKKYQQLKDFYYQHKNDNNSLTNIFEKLIHFIPVNNQSEFSIQKIDKDTKANPTFALYNIIKNGVKSEDIVTALTLLFQYQPLDELFNETKLPSESMPKNKWEDICRLYAQLKANFFNNKDEIPSVVNSIEKLISSIPQNQQVAATHELYKIYKESIATNDINSTVLNLFFQQNDLEQLFDTNKQPPNEISQLEWNACCYNYKLLRDAHLNKRVKPQTVLPIISKLMQFIPEESSSKATTELRAIIKESSNEFSKFVTLKKNLPLKVKQDKGDDSEDEKEKVKLGIHYSLKIIDGARKFVKNYENLSIDHVTGIQCGIVNQNINAGSRQLNIFDKNSPHNKRDGDDCIIEYPEAPGYFTVLAVKMTYSVHWGNELAENIKYYLFPRKPDIDNLIAKTIKDFNNNSSLDLTSKDYVKLHEILMVSLRHVIAKETKELGSSTKVNKESISLKLIKLASDAMKTLKDTQKVLQEKTIKLKRFTNVVDEYSKKPRFEVNKEQKSADSLAESIATQLKNHEINQEEADKQISQIHLEGKLTEHQAHILLSKKEKVTTSYKILTNQFALLEETLNRLEACITTKNTTIDNRTFLCGLLDSYKALQSIDLYGKSKQQFSKEIENLKLMFEKLGSNLESKPIDKGELKSSYRYFPENQYKIFLILFRSIAQFKMEQIGDDVFDTKNCFNSVHKPTIYDGIRRITVPVATMLSLYNTKQLTNKLITTTEAGSHLTENSERTLTSKKLNTGGPSLFIKEDPKNGAQYIAYNPNKKTIIYRDTFFAKELQKEVKQFEDSISKQIKLDKGDRKEIKKSDEIISPKELPPSNSFSNGTY